MKVMISIAVLMLVAIAVLFGNSIARGSLINPEVQLEWPMDKSGSHHIVIAIPSRFFNAGTANGSEQGTDDSNSNKSLSAHKDLLFEALWPNLSTKTTKNSNQFSVPGGGALMMALVSSGARDLSSKNAQSAIDISYDLRVGHLEHFCYRAKHDIFDIKIPPICVDQYAPFEKKAEFGLRHIGIDLEKYPLSEDEIALVNHDDLYYLRDSGGNIETFIECTPYFPAAMIEKGLHHEPQCNQFFYNAALNAQISVSYRKLYLSEWREIQSSWNALISGFVNASNKDLRK